MTQASPQTSSSIEAVPITNVYTRAGSEFTSPKDPPGMSLAAKEVRQLDRQVLIVNFKGLAHWRNWLTRSRYILG